MSGALRFADVVEGVRAALARDGWGIQVVGRHHDTLHFDSGTWRFHRRVAEFVS